MTQPQTASFVDLETALWADWAAIVRSLILILLVGVGLYFWIRHKFSPLKVEGYYVGPKPYGDRFATVVTARLRNRTKYPKTVSVFVLVRKPDLSYRLRHPFWRGRLEAIPFESQNPNVDAVTVEALDCRDLEGNYVALAKEEFPPFGDQTRILVKSGRKRPWIVRMNRLDR
ncbi:hypothetical protein [Streptomyces sp. NPDC057623]|uniref:hypothetical protein n=1 Tax=Streptomyces sp. NPDC057623 TaxID=3346187 RepID=UPI003694725E